MFLIILEKNWYCLLNNTKIFYLSNIKTKLNNYFIQNLNCYFHHQILCKRIIIMIMYLLIKIMLIWKILKQE